MALFKDEGLLLIDSADSHLRQLEKPFLPVLLTNMKKLLLQCLLSKQKEREHGFSRALEVERNSTNLFYYFGQYCELLFFDAENEQFISQDQRIRFTKAQVNELLEQFPERFSNNVVTRPLMQEAIFPTLAFIAGPGEIAYWGELKEAFEIVDLQMPPIVPRLNITLLDARIEQDLATLNVSLLDVLKNGVEKERDAFLQSIKAVQVMSLINETEAKLRDHYEVLLSEIEKVDRGLIQLTKKNLAIHVQQLQFLQRKVDEKVIDQTRSTVRKIPPNRENASSKRSTTRKNMECILFSQ